METSIDFLIFDLVEWVAETPRPYAEAIDRWRTSCPRLTVWEDAIDRGYLERTRGRSGSDLVEVTAAGRAFLAAGRRPVRSA
jgi:hypothetical protein